MNYKITFYLSSSISFTFKPCFDDILYAAYVKDILMTTAGRERYLKALPAGRHKAYIESIPILRSFALPLNIEEHELIQGVLFPIVQNPKGYYMASHLFYEKYVEDTIFFKKNWDRKGDFVADFGKKKRKVRVNNAGFKSYNLPFSSINTRKVWFFFQTKNLPEVERLLPYVQGIGKKRNRGMGRVKGYVFEKIPYNPFQEKIIRPIPVNKNEIGELMKEGEWQIALIGYKPPYWLPANQTFCRIQ